MWAWILFRISGLILVAYLFVHICVISQGRVSGAEQSSTGSSRSSTSRSSSFSTSCWSSAVLYHGLNGVRILLMDLGIGIRQHKVVFWVP